MVSLQLLRISLCFELKRQLEFKFIYFKINPGINPEFYGVGPSSYQEVFRGPKGKFEIIFLKMYLVYSNFRK